MQKKEDTITLRKKDIGLVISFLSHIIVILMVGSLIGIFGLGYFMILFKTSGNLYYSVGATSFSSALMMLSFILISGLFRGGCKKCRKKK